MMDPVIGSALVIFSGVASIITTYFLLKDRFKQKVVADVQPIITALETRVALSEKEIDHIKRAHANEIASLAKKLDELRDEVRQQHSQLVDLLMKFVPDPKRKG